MSLRSRRRRLRYFALALFLALLVGAGWGVGFASYLPQVSIQEVVVREVENMRPELVRAYVETILFDGTYPLLSRANTFLFPRTEIERSIPQKFPRIEEARVSRESLLATAIIVTVRERELFARWCSQDDVSCYALDRSGFVFASTASSSAGFTTAYIFKGALSENSPVVGQTYLPGRFAAVVALLERLGQAGFVARSISTEGEQDYSIVLERGYELQVTFGAEVSGLVRNLELILSSDALRGKENQLEYIDLRFGNRVYFKLKGEEQGSFE